MQNLVLYVSGSSTVGDPCADADWCANTNSRSHYKFVRSPLQILYNLLSYFHTKSFKPHNLHLESPGYTDGQNLVLTKHITV